MAKRKLSKLRGFAFVLLFLVVLAITYPIWFFLKLFKLTPNHIRNVDGNLETPIVSYIHPETKKIIVFIATIHIGDPEYFSSILKLIEGLSNNGYKILYESIKSLTSEEEEALTEKEIAVKKRLAYLSTLLERVGKIDGYQHQTDGLDLDNAQDRGWISNDIKGYEVVRFLAEKNIFTRSSDDDFKSIDRLVDSGLMNIAIGIGLRVFAFLSFIGEFSPWFNRERRIFKKFILHERNKIAFAGIEEYPNDNIVNIWGAGHLPGIEKKIKAAGYVECNRKWIVAYRNRPIVINFEGIKNMVENEDQLG